MRLATRKLLYLLCLPLIVLFTGCGSTSSGSFTLSSSSSSITIAQGASQTFTVTASGANSFKGTVTLAASGLPAGVTLTPSTATISPGGSATFTLAASSTAKTGAATVTVTGTSGSLTASTTLSLTVTSGSSTGPTGDFVLSVTPSSSSLTAGGSGQVTVSGTGVNAFSGNIAVSVSGLPSGVTASPMNFTLTPGTPVSVTLTAASTVATTSTPATIDFSGTSGSLSHVATLALSLTAAGGGSGAGDFSVALSPASLTLNAGGLPATTKAILTPQGGFSGAANVTVSGLPAGVTVNPASSSVSAGAAQAFVFTADTTAVAGTSTVTFTSTAGSITHTTPLTLTVVTPQAPPDFNLSLAPPNQSVSQGSVTTTTLSATPVNGYNGTIAVSIGSLPAGVTVSPTSLSLTTASPATVTFTVSASAAVGTSNIAFTALSGTIQHTIYFALTITQSSANAPDFSLALMPASLNVSQGAVSQTSLSASAVNGFTGQIAVVASSVPTGVTLSPASFNLDTGTAQSVALTVDAATTPGTYSIVLTGTSGTLSHATTLTLTVSAAGAVDFSMALSPSGLTIPQGGTDQSSLSINATNGFAGSVSVAAGALPTGITVSPLTFSVASGSPQSVSVAVDGATAPGTYAIDFTGTQGALQHKVTLTVTVTQVTPPPPADFSLALTPSSLSVAQGAIGQTSVSAAAIDGFTGQITVTPGALPSGVTVDPASLTLSAGNPQGVNLTVDAGTAPGTYSIDFNGVSGSIQHTVTLTLTVTPSTAPAPDYSLALTPAALSIAQGAVGQTNLSATALNGFTGQISVTAGTLPTGIMLSPSSTNITPGTPQSIGLTVDPSTAPGTYSIDFNGVTGATQHTVSLTLTVTQAATPDFSLAVTPGTLPVTQGSSGTVSISATAIGGFSDNIQVTVGTLPSGVVVTPGSFNLTTSSSVSVTVAASSSVPSGNYTITFSGLSGSTVHSTTLTLQVNPSSANSDFSLSLGSATISADQGTQSDIDRAYVTGSNGFNGNVAVTVTGMPSGVTLTGGGSTQDGGYVSFAFQIASTVAVGNYPLTVTGTSGSLTHSVPLTLTVTQPAGPETITVVLSPASTSVVPGSVVNISVTATGPSGYSGPVQLSVLNLPAGVTANPSSTSVTSGVPFTVTLSADSSAALGSYTPNFRGTISSVAGSTTLNLRVVQSTATGFDVTTWHYDNGRTGLNAFETKLSNSNVTAANFGKLSSMAADAAVDAQPLFVSGLSVNGQQHNVLYVVTENDTVYAYDADNGASLWQTSVLGTNEIASGDHGCSAISPKIGITATPVIDRNFSPNGVIFLVAMSKDSNGAYHQRLHGLDLTTGAEITGGPTEIAATYTPAGGVTSTFNPSLYVERSALLLNGGNLYLTWAAPCQQTTFDYGSWVMAYNEGTLQQESVLNLTPNGSGGAIWMSGAGPAVDTDGNVYLATSRGTFDTTLDASGSPVNGDYGNGFVKLQANNGVLSVFDYFEPINGIPGAKNYQDQGSGGVILIPDLPINATQNLSLAFGAGKDGNIYAMSRAGSHLGEYASGVDDGNTYTWTGALPNGATSSAAYFQGEMGYYNLFYAGGGDVVKNFDPSDHQGLVNDATTTAMGPAGATPVISSPGDQTGILWLLDTTASGGPVLHAYDANNLTDELYNSTQAKSGNAARDTVDATGKYTVPVVVNGHVYVGTNAGVDVFGLLPH